MKKFAAVVCLIMSLCSAATSVAGPKESVSRRSQVEAGSAIVLSGIAGSQPLTEFPQVNIPWSLRQPNWTNRNDEGSCVHATMTSLFRWQGLDLMAEHWKQTYSGPETANGLRKKLDREGIRYAETEGKGDVSFLEWAVATRRGCLVSVTVKVQATRQNPRGIGYHALALVHLDDKVAGLLDNRNVSNIAYLPREEFLKKWIEFESWALTPVYAPAPPVPSVNKFPRL